MILTIPWKRTRHWSDIKSMVLDVSMGTCKCKDGVRMTCVLKLRFSKTNQKLTCSAKVESESN